MPESLKTPSRLSSALQSILLEFSYPLSLGHISFREPFARFNKLHYVNNLLAEHDRERDAGQDPRNRAVKFICSTIKSVSPSSLQVRSL
jgi:hypothetical protein